MHISVDIVSSSARVTSVKFQQRQTRTQSSEQAYLGPKNNWEEKEDSPTCANDTEEIGGTGKNRNSMVVTEKLGKKYRKEKEVSATCTNDAEGLGTREETKINGRNTRRTRPE